MGVVWTFLLSSIFSLLFLSSLGDGPIQTEIVSQRAAKPKTTNCVGVPLTCISELFILHFLTGLRRQVNTQGGPAVAFFARLTSDSPQLSPNQDIVFNDVMINVGGGYHNVHGTFIAPVHGIYVFTTSVLSHKSGPNYAAHAKLVKNGTLLAILDASEPDGIAQASQTVIVQLAKGDDVAVQNEHYTGTAYYGSNYSTFSGFLLYDLSEPGAIVG